MVWKFSPVVCALGELFALNVDLGTARELLREAHIQTWSKRNTYSSDIQYAKQAAADNGRSFTHYDFSEEGYYLGSSKISKDSDHFKYALFHELLRTQGKLLALGAEVECYGTDKSVRLRAPVCEEDIARLEYIIDQAGELGNSTTIPTGPPEGMALYRAMVQCHRAERAMCELVLEMIQPEEMHLRYLNRLADFLLAAARFYQRLTGEAKLSWTDEPDEEITAEMCRAYKPSNRDYDY